MDACDTFAREVQELEVVDQREARTDIRLIAVASAMTLERIPQVAVVGIGCDVRLLIRGDDIEALSRIASVVRSDDRGRGIVHEDHILQCLTLSVADDRFGKVTREGSTLKLGRPICLRTRRTK